MPGYGQLCRTLTYKKLLEYFKANSINYETAEPAKFDNEQHGLGVTYPMPGGLKNNIQKHVGNVWIHQVEGQPLTSLFMDDYIKCRDSEKPFLADDISKKVLHMSEALTPP